MTRAIWRHVAIIVASLEALAVALWLIPASLHVVRWPASGPVRVALFAPQSRLVLLMIVTAAAAVASAGLAGTRRARIAHITAPLSLLWLWVLPFLPWLPERLPTLLILSGPVRWVIAATALVAAFVRSPPLFGARSPGGAAVFTLSIRRYVFVLSLLFYGAFGLLNVRAVGPGGDEPHYLIISQSLLADGDLKIENNHQRREYRAFWGGELRPDYLKRGIDGEIYSIHAPGVPALLLPAYAIGGYPATVLLMCLIAAFAATAIFDVAAALASVQAAVVTWAAVCFTVPFVPHAWLVFPEMPGTLVVAWALYWLWRPANQRAGVWALRGAALAALPWLHTKFVIFLASLAVALLWTVRSRLKAAFAFSAPIAVSVAAWLYFFYAFYGTINPEAPYGDYPAAFVLIKNIPRGLLGLVFDQKFGLLFYSPIYVFAIAGAWLLLRNAQTRWFGAVLVAVMAAHVGSTTRLYMWWGGTSAPARFLVPILPCLAPMIAIAVESIRQAAAHSERSGASIARALLVTCLTASVLIGMVGIAVPGRLLLFNDSRGYARLLETIQAGAPFTFSLPTFTYEDWYSPLIQLVQWLLIVAATVGIVLAAARSGRLRGLGAVTTGFLTLVIAAGIMSARLTADAREELARRGALDLLWQYDADRSRPFDYEALRKIDETAIRGRSQVTFAGYPVRPFRLPQGSYEARIWFGGALQRHGEIAVTSLQRVTFAQQAGALANPAVILFELPVDVGRLTVNVADKQVAESVNRVEIAPTVLTRGRDRVGSVRRIESIPERSAAYLVYVDDHSYPEGGVFWTRGLDRSEVLVAPGPYSKIRLTLHLGPNSGSVRMAVASDEQVVRVEPNGSAEVQMNVPHGMRLVPVTIQAPTSFRPSETDPASNDARTLGVQVRVTVE